LTYAQISDGVVENTIILDDVSLIPQFAAGFDYFVRIDELDPVPGIGWSYDGNNFSPPAGD